MEISYTLLLKPNTENTKQMYIGYKCKGDAGFDLYMPQDLVVPAKNKSFIINLDIKVRMFEGWYSRDDEGYVNFSHPLMLVPRSSTGLNTPLRLSNSIGIIDKDYRGDLKVVVDNISDGDFTINKGQRLFQLVRFSGKEFDDVEIVDYLDITERNDAGFGSTGK